jgi:fibronectin type 3 domain-containing protein
MPFAARLTRVSLLLSLTATVLWVAGCSSGYGGGGGGGGGNPPSAPTGLAATPGNAQVNLAWTAVSGATGYYVKRSTTTGTETQIATVSTTSYSDNAVTNGTKYFYVVSAYNSYGSSPNSAEVNATPNLSVPVAPTGLTATAGNAQVVLSWTASASATSYNVKRSTTSGGPYTIVNSPAATNYADTGLSNGTPYYYVVTAVNAAGESVPSSQASATPAPVPAMPRGLAATIGNAQVALTWNASAGATSYNVKRSATSGGPYTIINSPTVTSFTDTSLTNGTTYYYVVSAVNAIGESPNSTQVSAKPAATVAVAVTVDLLSNRHPINPNVYGGSYPKDAPTIQDSGLTVVRWGGNATSRYNWKTFTYNAANDYYYSDYVTTEIGDSDSSKFVTDVIGAGSNPLMTMVMLNWVSKGDPANGTGNGQLFSFDTRKYGAQCATNPSTGGGYAGNGLKPDCSTFVSGNDPNDANVPLKDDPAGGDPAGTVYRHPWATALSTAFGSAPHFYDMDNEIDIWAGTHRDVHPTPTTYNELRDTYLAESRALKTWDPAAIRFGPVSCCWYFYWRSANGGSDTSSHGGVDFLPWWLNEVAWSDAVAGNRSLDVFDIHAYPDGPSTTGFTLAQKQATALRVYRDWWDPTYTSEASYIVGGGFSIQPVDSKPFRIPRMRALLHTIYPGTQFSITEWSAEIAGGADFSTALGDAEAYGILGRERVDLASRWTTPDPANPNYQTLKLYRNYDSSHHTFGQTSISATHNADPNLFSVFAALGPANTPLSIMVVNKDPANAAQVTFSLNGFTTGTFKSYTLSQTSPTSIVASSSQAWSNSQTFPPYSATLVVVTGAPNATPAAEWDLNPDSIQIPAGGSFTFQPAITSATSGTASVNLSAAQFDASPAGLSLSIMKSSITQTPLTGNGAITVAAAASVNPGFYHFMVTGSDGVASQTQGGWVLVQKPASTFTKTGDGQSGLHGTTLNLSVTLNAGPSGGTNTGASILFSTDAGSFGGASKTLVTTNSSGVASVTLTLPSTAGTVHVTAEGPYGLGHPLATFTETAN